MTKTLADLVKLSSMKYDLCAQDLSARNAEVSELENEIAKLRTQLKTSVTIDGENGLALPTASAVSETWRRWCESQISRLNQQLSTAYVQREESRNLTREAFARKSAAQALLKQSNHSQKMDRQKRAQAAIINDEQINESPFIHRTSSL